MQEIANTIYLRKIREELDKKLLYIEVTQGESSPIYHLETAYISLYYTIHGHVTKHGPPENPDEIPEAGPDEYTFPRGYISTDLLNLNSCSVIVSVFVRDILRKTFGRTRIHETDPVDPTFA